MTRPSPLPTKSRDDITMTRQLTMALRARRFGSDEGGIVAVWFGMFAVLLLGCAGTGLDLARSMNQKTQIQGAVDAAARAGAPAYTSTTQVLTAAALATTYMADFKASSGITSLAYKVTPSIDSTGTVYSMNVSATSTIDNTLTRMVKASNEVDVQATASNPTYNLSVNMSGFSSDAVDGDSIYYYTVPADGSLPTTTTLLYTNNGSGPSSGTLVLKTTASQKIGFELVNVTDGNAKTTCTYSYRGGQTCTTNNYGSNQYGGASGSSHAFYSHLSPPSKNTYPTVAQNCSLQVTTGSTQPVTGCLSSLPANATVNCAKAAGLTLTFWWNDMGGPTDDKDYNDAKYSVSCSPANPNVGKSLSLVN